MKQKLLNSLRLRVCALVAMVLCATGSAWADDATYSLTPNQASTGSSSTVYITTLTEFTYGGVSWKMNQWNPSTLQVKTNQGSASSEFRFYNTSAFAGKIKQVVITFSALTVSDATKLMFLGGTSEVSATSGGTAGTWNGTAKTLTWTPGASDNFTYFAFYQNGKAASGTNYLAESDAIVVTYENNSTTPIIAASDVNLVASATAGEIAYTITNPASGVSLAAVEKTDVDWISNVAVDASNNKVTFTTTANTAYASREATITLSYTGATSKDVKVTQAAAEPTGTKYTWNLTTNSYDANPTDDLIQWSSDHATMKNEKNTGTQSVKNYIPTSNTSTRFYSNHKLTITPASGKIITAVVFTATTAGYATVLGNSTWTNASTYVNDTKVYVTPNDGDWPMSAIIGNTCGFNSVDVYYTTPDPNDNRAVVNITGFTATNSTIIIGGSPNTTATTVTNNQDGWTPSYTYTSSKPAVATVDANGVVTAVAKGTTTITVGLNIDNNDTNYKKGENRFATLDITVTKPFHTVQFYNNGTKVSEASVEEDQAITFPTLSAIDGFTFKGWATAAIDGIAANAPSYVTSANMSTSNVTYYAVYQENDSQAWFTTIVNRAAVNLSTFTADETTLIIGETTNTTVTNDQSGWTASYTYESSNTNVATVNANGVITAVAKGEATIKVKLNIAKNAAGYKTGATKEMSVTITVNKPSHTVTFYADGVQLSSEEVEEDQAITIPPATTITGYTFIGWKEGSAIDGTTNTAPTLAATNLTMGNANVAYYAVYAIPTDNTITATFDASDISNLTEINSLKWEDNATGITLELSAGQHYTSGNPNTWTVTKGTSNYFQITSDRKLTRIETTISGTSYKINSVQSGASLSMSSTKQTVTFSSSMTSVRCYATSGNQIRATTIVVNAGEITYSGYCTTIPVPSITVTPATVTKAANETSGTLAIAYEYLTISHANDFAVQFCNAQGEELAQVPDWISADVEVQQGNYVVSYIMTDANTSHEALTAYFKVWALDGSEAVYSNLVTITQDAAPITVTVTSVGYATYCSESALDFTNSSIKAYVGTIGNDHETLTFTKVNQVPANTGLLLYKEGGATEAVPVIASATPIQDNCLTGVNEETTIDSEDYILSAVGGGVGFYKAGQYTTLAAHRAYIAASVAQLVKSFAINLDDTDAIGAIKAVNDNADIFNLAGQRVNKAQKGIYIINGKKVLVK